MVTPLRTIVVLLMIVALFSCALTQTHAAEPGADSSLVIAALDVLKRDYPRPVKTVDLLNAAIAALRKATNLGPEKIPDLSAGLEDSKAVSTDLAYVATRGMLASLHDDPHVRYYDPAQWAERQQRAQSNYVGIGVIIRSKKDTSGTGLIFVEQVVSGSPAQAAGLRPLDRILEADGKPLQGMTTQEASGLIRGPAGSTLNLKIKRGGDVLSISIARAPITIPPVEAQMIQPGIVYVRLRAFPEGVGDLLRNQLRAMESRSTVVGVILDLRGGTTRVHGL